MTDRLFAYGTLLPGDVRWHFLEPFVVDEGTPDRADGRLFDTGNGYPAAVFADANDHDAARDDGDDGDEVVHGRVFTLHADRLDEALRVLDEVEGAVAGAYHRQRIVTRGGVEAWGYAVGGGLPLVPIAGGRWRPEWSRPLAD